MDNRVESKVIIIGAGPAGLAVGACLRKKKIAFELLEKSNQIGDSWQNHYERLHLHTVKGYSHLPFLEFPNSYPRYVSREQMCVYLNDYAQQFSIAPRFGMEVTRIECQQGQWLVHTRTGTLYSADAVVVATGVNRIPQRPAWKGEEVFEGQILHSKTYRRAQPFLQDKVLVVGMGNTGAEIALDLAEHGIETLISVRGPINIVPRDAFGRPTQLTARKLANLPNWLSDWLGNQMQRLTIGDLSTHGLHTPNLSPAKQLRIHGKTPVIDLGTVDLIRKGKIRILPEIKLLETKGVRFVDNSFQEVDTIILSTGYQPVLKDLVPSISPFLNEHGCPKSVIGEGPLAGLFFLGFDNYTPGGILGTIFRDAPRIADSIAQSL